MNKLLYAQGNLYGGYPYGVKIVGQFDLQEIHGPFSTENEAWNYGMRLANASDGTLSYSVVKIETPGLRSIATAQEIREHRQRETAATQNLVADMERDGLL